MVREEGNGIAVPSLMLGEAPAARLVEPDEGFHPARAIEVAPLVGKTQMGLDDGAADGFEIHHARIARHVTRDP